MTFTPTTASIFTAVPTITPADFANWLRGFMDAVNGGALTPAQVDQLREKRGQVAAPDVPAFTPFTSPITGPVPTPAQVDKIREKLGQVAAPYVPAFTPFTYPITVPVPTYPSPWFVEPWPQPLTTPYWYTVKPSTNTACAMNPSYQTWDVAACAAPQGTYFIGNMNWNAAAACAANPVIDCKSFTFHVGAGNASA